MRILSFDVGIQNLAYCYFSIDVNRDNMFSVYDWNILSLSDKICDYCSVRNMKCDKIAKYESIDKLYCLKHKVGGSKKIKDDLMGLHVSLVRQLDSLDIDPEYVVIENQPKFNPKMKTIASALYTYFAIRKLVDVKGSLKNICYIHPNYKITKVPYNGPELGDMPKAKYQRYKKVAIEYTKYFLRESSYMEYFMGSKKKDDLADAFLNGFAYFMVDFNRRSVKELQNEYEIIGTREEILEKIIRRNC